MSDTGQSVKRPEGNRALTHDPDKLLDRRRAAQLTVRDLAREAGVSIGSISMLENGHVSASVDMLLALARALNCRPMDLLSNELLGAAA